MSAAATAAGYLYASGRLRGRAAREQEPAHKPEKPKEKIRVAVLPAREEPTPEAKPEAPRRVQKIEYRTRKALVRE